MSSIGFVRSEVTALSRGELSPDQVMDSITVHIEKRLQDERERIAQAIEDKSAEDRLIFRVTAAKIARQGGELR